MHPGQKERKYLNNEQHTHLEIQGYAQRLAHLSDSYLTIHHNPPLPLPSFPFPPLLVPSSQLTQWRRFEEEHNNLSQMAKYFSSPSKSVHSVYSQDEVYYLLGENNSMKRLLNEVVSV